MGAEYFLFKTLFGHGKALSSVKFSPCGQWFVSSAADKYINLWNAFDGTLENTYFGHTKGLSDVAWSSDSQFLVSASDDKTLKIWNLDRRYCVKTLYGHENYVYCCNFNKDSNLIVSGSVDKTVRLWDVETGQCLRVIQNHTDTVTSVCFDDCGRRMVSGSIDGACKLWETSSGECEQTYIDDGQPAISSVRFSPDGLFLLIAFQNSKIKLLDFKKNLTLVARFRLSKSMWANCKLWVMRDAIGNEKEVVPREICLPMV